MKHTYSVYILASRSRSLYTGVTGDLENRMIQHRKGLVPGFTTRYRIFRLVHFELFGHINDAIAREKEIKGWRREKKINLIEQKNPTWDDLAPQLPHSYKSQKLQSRSLTRSPNTGERIRDDKATDQETDNATINATDHANGIPAGGAPLSFRTK